MLERIALNAGGRLALLLVVSFVIFTLSPFMVCSSPLSCAFDHDADEFL